MYKTHLNLIIFYNERVNNIINVKIYYSVIMYNNKI